MHVFNNHFSLMKTLKQKFQWEVLKIHKKLLQAILCKAETLLIFSFTNICWFKLWPVLGILYISWDTIWYVSGASYKKWIFRFHLHIEPVLRYWLFHIYILLCSNGTSYTLVFITYDFMCFFRLYIISEYT